MDQLGIGISEFYQDQSILITGGTGFMGKVLVEKLLRSCPGIDKIFLIVRTKRNKDTRERIRTLFDVPLFDRLREEQPTVLEKVIAIPGDMMESGLNLSPEDRKTLQENVSVVFNTAATIRFDEPIRDAVMMNVRGVRDMIELALTMKKLKVFVHVSTTYANVDHLEVREVLYPPPGNWDWKKMIRIAEELDDYTLRILTPNIIGNRPNTYTFTKALGEQVIDYYKDRLPTVIVRPSIVLYTYEDPIPGWGDSLHGPVAVMAGVGMGILRIHFADPDKVGDYVPADMAIKVIVMAGWAKGLKGSLGCTDIFNSSSGLEESLPMREVMSQGMEIVREHPLSKMLWYPNARATRCRKDFDLNMLLFCLLPALIVDAGLWLAGRKQFMIKAQRKIYVNILMLSYFCNHQWTFHNDNWMALKGTLLTKDHEEWCFDKQNCGSTMLYGRISYVGCRKYLLKDDLSTLPESKVTLKRMYWVDRMTKASIAAFFLWIIFSFSLPQHTIAVLHRLPFVIYNLVAKTALFNYFHNLPTLFSVLQF